MGQIVPVIVAASFPSEKAVRGSLAFLNHRLRAPFVYAYWAGERIVDSVRETVENEEYKHVWAALYGQMPPIPSP